MVIPRFEKSLYDLIRGLRNHKGSEKEYIQDSLRECRAEIRGSDMDVKATALMKLIYLEMFGHDMSWASFHVLEVMSSTKYLQKRVGYLGAVQSFRPDTEVLMLATNLFKKDITSPLIPMIGLPLVALPHVINSTLALSLLSDLIPRLSHSSPAIRKKIVVVLYRLALVYPDTLRPAWPKIKDILLDENEDSSVTAAVINVVCELGWRRPADFLSLAPRFFDLLVDSGNNWMAIKIIKLFATLTPLEPRLIKKLLPPLTNIIRTTPAMSLLYECIHGIIHGGIFEGTEGQREGDEIAELCVGKLRGMIMVDGDPNLKYVALLAMKKIVMSHPYLVSMHQDVIMECIDDLDISIRSQALELLAGMANSDNIVTIVDRLIGQLSNSSFASTDLAENDKSTVNGIVLAADPDEEDPERSFRSGRDVQGGSKELPNEYRLTIISRILDMCTQNTYSNIVDFEWYIDTLVKLARFCPLPERPRRGTVNGTHHPHDSLADISGAIGNELLNVAVRVSTVRVEAATAARSLVLEHHLTESPMFSTRIGEGVLRSAVWIIGEYANDIVGIDDTLTYLLHPSVMSLSSASICAYLQAVPKVLVCVITNEEEMWNAQRKTLTILLLARFIHFLEPLTMHPDLEVQERSVEFLELMRVASQATSTHEAILGTAPLLLTDGLSSLFIGLELNPVAPSAQRKVPPPSYLDLSIPLNEDLTSLLQCIEKDLGRDLATAEFDNFYSIRQNMKGYVGEAMESGPAAEFEQESYQNIRREPADAQTLHDMRAKRRARNKDDPYYIEIEESSAGVGTSMQDFLKHNNGGELDVDSIPIMDLDLGNQATETERAERKPTRRTGKVVREYQIAPDENINFADHGLANAAQDTSGRMTNPLIPLVAKRGNYQQSLLTVDSSGLESFSLDVDGRTETSDRLEKENRATEDLDMQKALLEVERLRLEMQRAAERIQVADGIPLDGTIVKKKKKKKKHKGDQPTSSALHDEGNSLAFAGDTSRLKPGKRKQGEPVPPAEESNI